MIREEDLIEFGFLKEEVSAEESGTDCDWYYYSYRVGDLDFISSESDTTDATNGEWNVQLMGIGITFTNFEDLKEVILTLEKYAE